MYLASCGVNEPHGRMTQGLGDFCVILLGIFHLHTEGSLDKWVQVA